jgi:hypothetical protein
VSGDLPQMATADGGVIGQSGTIYSQNGQTTGQTSILTQSWRGNMYQLGSVEQVAVPQIPMAMSLWANAGGSPSGNNSAGRPWYFQLVWQNNCSSSAQPCGFTLYPENPQDKPELAIDATSQAVTIKAAALAAMKKAFSKYPVNVSEGRPNTGDNRANVVNGFHFDGVVEYCGETNNWFDVHDSSVYYRRNMEMAQFALPIVLNTVQDTQNALSRIDLMRAIGAGIGNTAAHEIAHQFFVGGSGMEDSSANT